MTAVEPGQSEDRSDHPPRPTRPRRHRRVVRPGKERFDVDGVLEDPEDRTTREDRLSEDDRRILGELPPHWGLFPAERDR